MAVLNYIPLFGAVIAFLLGILILANKNQGKKARFTLSAIVFLSAHNLFESYMYYNNFSWWGLGWSYVHFHITGALFLLYTNFLFKIEINLKPWVVFLIIYTLLRLQVLEPVDEEFLENPTNLDFDLIAFIGDYFISILLNISFLFLALLEIRKINFSVKLTNYEKLNFSLLKSMVVVAISLYVAILIGGIFSSLDQNQWLIYVKLESILISIFCLLIAYCTMRFPIFSVYGDFRDLDESDKKKYISSALTKDEAQSIWNQINQLMSDEKPYLNPEYRLNDLANRLGRPLHYVSRVINEKEGTNFSDYVNRFRVEDAKTFLSSEKAKQVTILAIALEVGFNSKSSFYKTFRKITGRTPSDFMKEYSR